MLHLSYFGQYDKPNCTDNHTSGIGNRSTGDMLSMGFGCSFYFSNLLKIFIADLRAKLFADSERIASVPFRQDRQLYYLFGAQIKTLLYSKVEYGDVMFSRR